MGNEIEVFESLGFFLKNVPEISTITLIFGSDLNVESVLECQLVGQGLDSMTSLKHQKIPGIKTHSSGSFFVSFSTILAAILWGAP